MTTTAAVAGPPVWLRAAAAFGVLWNVYGLYQFIGSFSQTPANLMAIGMTSEQAALYLSLPAWISAAFAIGVVGGLVGSIALLLGRTMALPVLFISLAGYILLFAGDAWYGVFANIPAQLVILSVVVLIAAGLAWAARHASARGLLA